MTKGRAILTKKISKRWQFTLAGLALLLLIIIVVATVTLLGNMTVNVQF